MIRCFSLALILCAAAPSVAQAQIYVWRDASGNLVLSDKQKDPSAQTYAVPTTGTSVTATEFRTTKPLSRRALAFDPMIEQNAAVHGVSPHLVRAVIQQESGFNPRAVSHKGAMGLMQLMPATAIAYGVSNAYDPVQNIRAGVAYLRSLLERYSQNEELALAAYNAGPTAVKKYGDAVPPYRETRNYVAKIRKEAGARPAPTRVYKVVEFQDGREIIRYTNTPPSNKPDAVNAPIR